MRKHFCQLKNISKLALRPTSWMILLNQFRMFTTISTKHPDTRLIFRKTTAIDAERKRHIHSDLWFTIHPYSMCSYHWRLLMAIIYFLVTSCDLFNVAVFKHILSDNTGATWLICYIVLVSLLNIICIIDMAVNFLTGYLDIDYSQNVEYIYSPDMQQKEFYIVVLEKKKIAVRYLKSFFIIDSLAFIYLIYRYFKFSQFEYNAALVRLLRLTRFYTIINTARYVVNNISRQQHFFQLLCSSFSIVYTIFFFACLRLSVPEILASLTEREPVSIWEVYKKLGRHVDSRVIFLHSLYDAANVFVTAEVVCYSHHVEELTVNFINSVTSLHVRAWWLASLIMYFDAKFSSWLIYDRFKGDVHHFLRSTEISRIGLRNVMVYIENTLGSEMFQEKEILNTLETRLQFEIFTRSSMDLVRNCHLFWDLSNKIISSLASRLKYETYAPGELLLKTGSHANCMYFIASGTVAVYNRRGRELCHLSDGEYFGEIGLLNTRSGRTADVIVLEQSKVYRLDIKDFHAVIKPKSKLYRSLLKGSVLRSLKRSIVISKAALLGSEDSTY